jgi:glycosyltransferase involved in cell wall biosynthesis
MRVMLITDWPALEGGTERYVSTLRSALQSSGDEVHLLTSSAGSRAGGTAEHVAYGSRTRAGRALTQVVNPVAARAVRRAVEAFQPDVAHVHMFMSFLSPAILPALGRAPTVLTLHDYRAVCPAGWNMLPDGSPCRHSPGVVCRRAGCISRLRRAREAPRYAYAEHAMRDVARILTDSEWMRESLASKGIDADVLPPTVAAPRRFTHRRGPNPVFVYAGRLDAEKGVRDLILAFAAARSAHPAARLRVCGDGSERRWLQTLAADRGLGGSVEFATGMRPDWWGALADAWALVVPSRWHEPFGLVAVEAIVRGVPVIASDVGGLRETVVHGVTGLLYPREDEAALTRCLIEVADGCALDEGSADGEVARLADRHDPNAHTRRLRQIFDEVAIHAPA